MVTGNFTCAGSKLSMRFQHYFHATPYVGGQMLQKQCIKEHIDFPRLLGFQGTVMLKELSMHSKGLFRLLDLYKASLGAL